MATAGSAHRAVYCSTKPGVLPGERRPGKGPGAARRHARRPRGRDTQPRPGRGPAAQPRACRYAPGHHRSGAGAPTTGRRRWSAPGAARGRRPALPTDMGDRGAPGGNAASHGKSAKTDGMGDRGSGVSPRETLRAASRLKPTEHRATPGGYGGKPPGVAFIGVPTGARNAGRCSDGGPEHHVHGTPKPPLVRQDLITGSARRGCFPNRGTGLVRTGRSRVSRGQPWPWTTGP